MPTAPTRWPDHVLAGLVLVSIWGLFVFTAQSGNAFTTYLIPIALIATIRRHHDTLHALLRDPLYVCFLLLLVYLGVSAAWSAEATVVEFLKAQTRVLFIVGYVTAVIVLNQRYPRLVEWIVLGVIGTATFSTLVAVAAEHTAEGRLIGFGDLDRAVVAGISWGAASVIALLLLMNDDTRRWSRPGMMNVGIVFAAATTFAAMLWSGSRTAWVACATAITCMSLLAGRRRGALLLFWGGVIVGTAVLLRNTTAREWLLPRGDSFRWEIWSSTFDAIVHGNWLFGRGLLSRFSTTAAGYEVAHPHSVYLATLYQGGVVALGILVTLLGWALARAIRFRRLWTGQAAATLLVFAIVAMAPDGAELIDKVGYLWLLLWTPLAWTIALGRDRV